MLLAVLALAAAGLESVSFGHQHLSDSHSLYHHHVFFGSHEHFGAPPDHHHDHDHDHDRDDDHGAPAPAPHHHHKGAPRRSATVSAVPVLAQPIGVTVLAAPRAEPILAAPAVALAPVARPVSRLTPPRAPPASL